MLKHAFCCQCALEVLSNYGFSQSTHHLQEHFYVYLSKYNNILTNNILCMCKKPCALQACISFLHP